MNIILATTSRSRIETMRYTGIQFTAVGSRVDEYFDGRPTEPCRLVKVLSQMKAEAVAQGRSDSLVIGMDSVAYFDNQILEKPRDYDEAFARLKAMSGKMHEYYTGITAIDTDANRVLQDCVVAKIKLREISDSEIKRYLKEDQNYVNIALGYEPSKFSSASFIEELTGEPFNVQGMPLSRLVQIINEMTGEK